MLITSSRQGKCLLFLIQLLKSKSLCVFYVSAKFQYEWLENEVTAAILKKPVFSNFWYSSEQKWRDSDVIIHLILIFLVPEDWSYPEVTLYKIWVS